MNADVEKSGPADGGGCGSDRRRGVRSLLAVLALLLTLTITGCGTTFDADLPTFDDPAEEATIEPDEPAQSDDPTQSDRDLAGSPLAAMSLRGDPAFDSTVLSSEQRIMYDAIRAFIQDKEGGSWDPYAMAGRDDIWWMGHGLQTHVQAVLVAFRITGDLELLDHLDELAELARSKLADGWRGTTDGTDGTRDGYLNWVMRANTSGQPWNAGKDTNIQYDMKAHATMVHIAYALHANRDLSSPKGYDYAAHADFWQDYMVNHFEAKLRSRHDKATGFPIHNWPPQVSSYSDWTKWHYYMGLLTGEEGYTAEARRMSDVILDHLHTVSTPLGEAYVWSRNNPAISSSAQYLSPTSYADFVFANAVEFHLEGFHAWADPVHMERFARTITQLIMDEPDPIRHGLAADVGGERTQDGIYSESGFRRITPFLYSTMNFALLAPWDITNTLASLTADVHDYSASHDVDTSRILTSLMLNTHLRPDPAVTASASAAR